MVDLASQYDAFADDFVRGAEDYNFKSRKAYYSALEMISLKGGKVLDVGCGDGWDLQRISSMGAEVFGIDSSSELVRMAQKNNPDVPIVWGDMNDLPFKDSYFDVVLSKYVIQTSEDVPKTLVEMSRVLKAGGTLAYLAVHPLRQFLEKKKHPKDYFMQEVVESRFFGGRVSANEPTHTFNEYFNKNFLRSFRVDYFEEFEDFPSSERMGGDNYPCFFIVSATKTG